MGSTILNSTPKTTIRIDANNNLVINQTVTKSATWTLSDTHELGVEFDAGTHNKNAEKLVISGVIKDVTSHALHFQVESRLQDEKVWGDIITLKGTWQANANNQLIFKVKKEHTEDDILTLTQAWKIDKTHQIIYEYEKVDLLTKARQSHRLAFKGYWNQSKDHRLYYELEKTTTEPLVFSFGTAQFKKNKIVYKLMIGHNPTEQTLNLSGEWRVSSEIELQFKLKKDAHNFYHLSVGGELTLSDTDTLAIAINHGLDLKLSRAFLDADSNAFVGLHFEPNNPSVSAGVEIKF